MKIDYQELKRRIRLQDLLETIGWQRTQGRGEQLRGPCPLPGCRSSNVAGSLHNVTSFLQVVGHNDRTLSVNTDKNVYRCFRCRSAGNVLDFWQAYRQTTLHAAASELLQNIEISNPTYLSKPPLNPQHSSSHPAKVAGS